MRFRIFISRLIFLRYLAIFVLGALSGATAINALTAHHLEELILANDNLRQQLQNTAEELVKVKENLAQPSYQVVTAIEAHITFVEGDKLPAVEQQSAALILTREAQKILAPLKGQEVKKLNPILIPAMIDGRLIPVNGRQFRLKADLVLISEKLIIYLQARLVPPSL
ncbi:MAG: hypothetical protein PWP65_1312 [Clostridia bacterium]|nr:hypothetical protein [Clostridia bacterium]